MRAICTGLQLRPHCCRTSNNHISICPYIVISQPLTIANPDRVKLKFYSSVLGDNSTFIHYGKWDGLDTDQPGAYGRASEAMTDYMYKIAVGLLPHRAESDDVRYVDMGSGTGGEWRYFSCT